MRQLLNITRFALPAGGMAAAVAVGWGGPVAVALAAACGLCLGALLQLMLHSVAVSAGDATVRSELGARRLEELEHDKQQLLRAIKDIEFDAELQRLTAVDVSQLTAPLRQRATRLFREIDQARAGDQDAGDVDAQIEREIERRLSLEQS